MGGEQEQGITRNSSSTLWIPLSPATLTTAAPLREIGQDQQQRITQESTPAVRIAPPAQARPNATSHTLAEIPELEKGRAQGKTIIEDATSGFPIPPGDSTSATPLRRRSSSHTHHHWRIWGPPQRKFIPGQTARHRQDRKARYEAVIAKEKDKMDKLAKVIITATNMHSAALMTCARIVAQAIDRQTDALNATETTSNQKPPTVDPYTDAQ